MSAASSADAFQGGQPVEGMPQDDSTRRQSKYGTASRLHAGHQVGRALHGARLALQRIRCKGAEENTHEIALKKGT